MVMVSDGDGSVLWLGPFDSFALMTWVLFPSYRWGQDTDDVKGMFTSLQYRLAHLEMYLAAHVDDATQ